jgi:hypothetical protein
MSVSGGRPEAACRPSIDAIDPNRTNYDQRVGLKLLQLELLGAKARGLARVIFLCEDTVIE